MGSRDISSVMKLLKCLNIFLVIPELNSIWYDIRHIYSGIVNRTDISGEVRRRIRQNPECPDQRNSGIIVPKNIEDEIKQTLRGYNDCGKIAKHSRFDEHHPTVISSPIDTYEPWTIGCRLVWESRNAVTVVCRYINYSFQEQYAF